jgi:hypothetical protein
MMPGRAMEGDMTHKEQLIAMLDDARIDWGHSQGDCVVITHCASFRFSVSGKLVRVESEGGYSYDD